jgi:hypothetical protein
MLNQESQAGLATPVRSRSITILAGLHLLQSLALLGFGIYLVQTSGWAQHVTFARAFRFMPFALVDSMVSGIVMVVLAVLGVMIAVALLGMRPWAWLAAICLQGIGLASALYGYFRNRPNFFGMLIGILLVLYLNQHEVRAAFRGRSSF